MNLPRGRDFFARCLMTVAIVMVALLSLYVAFKASSTPDAIAAVALAVPILSLIVALETYDLRTALATLRSDDSIINYIRAMLELMDRWDHADGESKELLRSSILSGLC